MTYQILKLLHIVSVIVFLGNILTGLFWAAHANRTRNFAYIASTFEGIIRSDRILTTPGVVGILASGIAAAILAELPLLGTGWILWSLALFGISGAAFGMGVAPLQRRLAAFALTAESSDQAWKEYKALYRNWELWGLVAIVTPALALIVMVLKPEVPAF